MRNSTIVDSYPLTALQEGMLFHQLSSGGKGVDVEQISIRISHRFNADKFIGAWQALIAQHPPLRTAFDWRREEEPRQCVAASAALPVTTVDYRADANDEEFSRHVVAFQEKDRLQDFDLTHPPLMRLAIIYGPNGSTFCLWTFHHILLDGRSFPLLLNELFSNYDASVAGTTYQPPERPDFARYVDWFKARSSTEDERFWRQELQGVSESVHLTFGSPATLETGPMSEYSFSEIYVDFPNTANLVSFADSQDVTFNTLLQTAWALLLHHYTRETDIIFGSTRACRHSSVESANDMLGLLINTVPFRVQLNDEITLAELLRTVRTKHIELREYEFTPLKDIRRIAGISSDMLFESLVVFESYLLKDRMKEAGGLYLEREFNYRGQTNFPLALIAYGGDRLLLRIEYDKSQFSEEVVKDLLAYLQVLLVNFTLQFKKPAVEVEYLSETECKALVNKAQNQSQPRSERLGCIHSLFEQQVEKLPNHTALSYEEKSFSYARLNEVANNIAHHLIDLGVQPGDYIGLCFERSADLVIGLLGILKAGAAYVPLDPNYPQDRLAYIIEDGELEWILSRDKEAKNLPQCRAKIVCADLLNNVHTATNPKVNVDSTNIAYIIYTSGSTGKPKGVKVRHDNVCRLFHSTAHWYNFNEKDVWTLFHSTAFDFSVWEIWGALIYGGRLVVIPYWISRSPDKFYELVLAEKVTILNQTPSAFRQFIESDQSQSSIQGNFLRYVIFGGEALDLQSLRPWYDAHGDQQPSLVNMYGITETTVHVTYRPITEQDLTLQRGSVIGEPIPDLNLYLLNDHLKPVPTGVVGELYIGGAGVTDGYLNREALTSERFIESPFDSESVLYKTGDLALYLYNGELEYRGRSDFQVKVRGFRIEMGEVEARLQKHAAIRQAIVDVYEDESQESRLLAYLLFHDNQHLSVSKIRDYLSETLPDYMVPSLYIPIDSIPLTHNGKIDKKGLPEPIACISGHEQYMAPRNNEEVLLENIWSRVLNREKIGINDNFFDLGGDSILTIKIVAALREEGYQVTPKQIFKAKTIAGLAMHLEPSRKVAIQQEKVCGDVPLGAAQEWFFAQAFDQPDYWNQTFLFDLSEPLGLEPLEQSFSLLLQHHDVLRARYEVTDSGWKQVFLEDDALALHLIDLHSLTEEQARLRITADCLRLQSSLDISCGPTLVAAYFSLENCSDKLLICAHHLLIDGISWGILLKDLETLYRIESGARELKLPLRTLPLKSWVEHSKAYANSRDCENNLGYWKELDLSSSQRLPLQAFAANLESDAGKISFKLSPEQTTLLLTASNTAYNTKINDLLLTAFMKALGVWQDISCLLIDMEGHGREDLFENSDVSRTLGWFTSIYPLRLELSSQLSIKQQIQTIKEQVRKIPNQGFDYMVAKHFRDSVFASNIPEAEILFNYLGQFDQTVDGLEYFQFSEEDVAPWHGPGNTRTHTLELLGWVRKGCLQFDIHYNLKIHKGSDIEQFSDLFQDALLTVIRHCTSITEISYTPSDFPLVTVSQAEIDKMMSKFSIVDIYPLSPMQKLFHTADLIDPAHGFEQWHFEFAGPLDIGKYQQAWQAVIDRHDILRSAVVELENGELAQMVASQAKLTWYFHDQSAMAEASQHAFVEDLKQSDRTAHFQLDRAPLARVNLVKVGNERFQLIWSTHHLCIDGWSWPLVFSDISNLYGHGELTFPQTTQYGDYIDWLCKQHFPGMEAFWKKLLEGYREPLLFERIDGVGSQENLERKFVLSKRQSQQLEELARNSQVTLNTVFQAMWALVLASAGQLEDVVFGVSSSGRPTDITGVDTVVGPFVNNIPKRISVPKNLNKVDWLQSIQESSLASVLHEYASPVDIQKYCGLPLNQRLFETLLVFQNYELPQEASLLKGGVRLKALDLPQSTNYPLTLVVVPGEKIQLTGYFQQGYLVKRDVDDLFADIAKVLEFLIECSDIDVQVGHWKIRRKTASSNTIQVANSDITDASSIEKTIADIWAKAFSVESVNLHQSFFEMGGQSIMLVSMHAEIQQAIGKLFPITQFFRSPTISSLAAYFDGGEADSSIDRDSIRQKTQLKKLAQRNAQRKRKARVRK